MAAFSELIRSFDKIRDYMRDFYIYGFKQRNDFNRKSARTYDNEKRRIESYLTPYISWRYDKNGKRTFLSLDSTTIASNPLYAAWKSKSFTPRDIMLHFYILDCLRNGSGRTIEAIADYIATHSRQTFEIQTVRLKCSEYVKEGVLHCQKQGKTFYYRLEQQRLPNWLLDAIAFYQGVAPFGQIGSCLLDNAYQSNQLFGFQHYYIVHTLEDGILLHILQAMRKQQMIMFENHSTRSSHSTTQLGIPLKIFQSAATGRRYICIFTPQRRRFVNYRLDYIRSVKPLHTAVDYDALKLALERKLPLIWGVSFGSKCRQEVLCMKLYINEQSEQYVLKRLHKEGRGGEVLRLKRNVYLYTKDLYDTNEISPWIKTFIGRIIALESTNRHVIDKFYRDLERMQQMYSEGGDV